MGNPELRRFTVGWLLPLPAAERLSESEARCSDSESPPLSLRLAAANFQQPRWDTRPKRSTQWRVTRPIASERSAARANLVNGNSARIHRLGFDAQAKSRNYTKAILALSELTTQKGVSE
jgi:hypothetical protein